MNLEAELKKIKRLITTKATQINNEANTRGVLYSGMPIIKKIEDISQILEDEICRLTPNFKSSKHQERINAFIDEQKKYIYKSAKAHGLEEHSSLSELDSRMEELKDVISNKRIGIIRKDREELMRFWVPVGISLVALAMSILSLVQAGNHGK